MAVTGHKIYIVGNIAYIDQIVDSGQAFQYEGLAKDCLPRKKYVDSTEFSFSGFNGLDETKAFPFAQLKDGNGDAWADQATFEAWATSNLGKPSAGDSADAGTFTGAFALSSTTPQYYDDYTQSGALTLSIGGSSVLGGIAKVKITANGSTIDGFASWKNLGGDTITNTNGAVNYIIVNKTKTEIHYTVKVL